MCNNNDVYNITDQLNSECKKEMLILFDEVEYKEEEDVETNIEINKILH